MKTLLVFATPRENQFGNRLPKECTALITGIGKLNAALSLSRALQKKHFDRIVNLGICGSVVSHFDVGSLVEVSTVIEGDRNSFGHSLRIELPSLLGKRWQKGTLVTQDCAVKTTIQKKQVLSLGGELVDMEGFALAKTAQLFDIPFHCLKIVSDRASLRSSESILKNIAPCSQKLCAAWRLLQ